MESPAAQELPPEAAPDDLNEGCQIFALEFHPTDPLLAIALVTGQVNVHRCTVFENQVVHSWQDHGLSCRDVAFSDDGKFLYTASSDKTFRVNDVTTGQHVYTQLRAHSDPINSMITFGNMMLATGDDEGHVKVWDMRQQKQVWAWKDNEDFIADLAFEPNGNLLYAAGGDGHFSVFHTRKGILEARSDQFEDELLSICIMKGGRKVVVGTQGGVLNIFSKGDFGDISDRFPGHPNSVDALVALDEDVLVTGSSDGLLRVVQIIPNQLMGVVGEHGDLPIEALAITGDKNLLASASHDHSVRFWNLSWLYDEDDGDEDADGGDAVDAADASTGMDTSASEGKRVGKGKHKPKTKSGKGRFWSGV